MNYDTHKKILADRIELEDNEYILQSLQVGALGYLLKRTPAPEIATIRSVAQGYSQLGPTIAPKAFS